MARSTLIVVVVFLALAGGVFALEKTNPATPADAQVYVLDVKDTDVQRLDVQTAAGTQGFDRADPFGWKFAASGDAADLSRVSSVVNRLAKLRSSSKVSDKATDLSPYGLTPPVDTATLTMKDGTIRRVLIGNKTVNDAAYYAIVEGTIALHTINTLLVGDIEKLISDPPVPTPTPDPSASATPRPESTATLTRTPSEATPVPIGTIPLPVPSTN
jgi:hypothetical protein